MKYFWWIECIWPAGTNVEDSVDSTAWQKDIRRCASVRLWISLYYASLALIPWHSSIRATPESALHTPQKCMLHEIGSKTLSKTVKRVQGNRTILCIHTMRYAIYELMTTEVKYLTPKYAWYTIVTHLPTNMCYCKQLSMFVRNTTEPVARFINRSSWLYTSPCLLGWFCKHPEIITVRSWNQGR